jgi:hypothetical protein
MAIMQNSTSAAASSQRLTKPSRLSAESCILCGVFIEVGSNQVQRAEMKKSDKKAVGLGLRGQAQ